LAKADPAGHVGRRQASYHSTDLLTAHGVAHLVVHGTSASTSYETIPHVPLETSGGVPSTVDVVVQRRYGYTTMMMMMMMKPPISGQERGRRTEDGGPKGRE